MIVGGNYTIDFAKVSNIPKFAVGVKAGDSKRKISLTLLENNVPINLNYYNVVVACKKSDGNDILNTVNKIDAVNGKCEVEITNQMLALDTDLPCEIVLYGSNGTVATSSNFVIGRISSIRDNKSIVSSSEFTALSNALTKVQNIENEYRKNSVSIQLKDLHTEVKTAMTGGSVAVVGENMVGSENIKDLSIEARHLKENSVNNNALALNSVRIDNLNVSKVGEGATEVNIHDYTTTTEGGYVNYNTGEIIKLSEFGYSDFIEVIPGEELILSCNGPIAFCVWFNSDKKWVGKTDGASSVQIKETTVTVPSDACYLRFNYQLSTISKEDYQVKAIRGGAKVVGSQFIADKTLGAEQLKDGCIKTEHLSGDIKTTPQEYSIESYMLKNDVLEDRHFNKNLFMSDPSISYPSVGESGFSIKVSEVVKTDNNFFITMVLDNPFTTEGGTYNLRGKLILTDLNTYDVDIRTFRGPTSNPSTFDDIPGIIHDEAKTTITGGELDFDLTANVPSGVDYPYLKICVSVLNCKDTEGFKAKLENTTLRINGRTITKDKIIAIGSMQSTSSKVEFYTPSNTFSNRASSISIVREEDLEYTINSHLAEFHQGETGSNGTVVGLSQWAGKKILAIGDSITDKGTPETKYIHFIADKIGCSLTNNGISGSGFINGTSLVNRINSLGNDYDLIYVFLGTNDYGNNGGVELGAWGSSSTSDFYGAVDYCFNKLVEKYPLKTIAILTPLPRRNGWSKNTKGYTMDDYCEAIRRTAEKYSFPLLDLHKYSGFLANNNTFNANYCYYSDGLHPNTAWHRDFLAKKVLSFFETL